MAIDSQKLYEDYLKWFQNMNEKQIIDAFNLEVGNTGWTGSRASYIAALHVELGNRNYDYSAIGNRTSLSFKNKIKLVGKKILIDEYKNN